MKSFAALLVASLVVVLACGAMGQGPVQSTLQDPKNLGVCLTRFKSVIATYYANDRTCGDKVTKAMNTTVPADCPDGVIAVAGTPVHFCMNKNNTNKALLDAWSGFIRSCEVMYIANRGGQGESEEGFTYKDNSCFPRFNSFGEFSNWLNDASRYAAGAQPGSTPAPVGGSSAASSVKVALSSIAAALVLALFVMWA